MANEKVNCGGFVLDNTVLEMQKDPVSGKPMLTVTGNVPVTGAEFIILKSSESSKKFKITVNDAGVVSAVEYKE